MSRVFSLYDLFTKIFYKTIFCCNFKIFNKLIQLRYTLSSVFQEFFGTICSIEPSIYLGSFFAKNLFKTLLTIGRIV